jgi:Transcriptional regulator
MPDRERASTHLTKLALASSLKKLMSSKSFGKISVREIIEDSGLNRQTFYYHFRDSYDLAKWTFELEAIELVKRSESCLSWDEGILLLLEYVRDNAALCRSAMSGIGREHLEALFYGDVEAQIRRVVDELAAGRDFPERQRDFLAEFYTLAFVGVLVRWLKTDMRESPAEMLELFRMAVEGNIKAAIDRYGAAKGEEE